MRFRARVDANQREIVDALRRAGRSVLPTHQLGRGFPDLIVGFRKRNFLIEIKTDKGKLTDDQKEIAEVYRGTILVVRTAEEAIRVTE